MRLIYRMLSSLLVVCSLLISPFIFGNELRYCYIKDPHKHANNRELLKNILECERLLHNPELSGNDIVYYLSDKISHIAKGLMESGFSVDAYAIPALDSNSIVAFNCFVLWEGEKDAKHPVPLTFFIYVWPPEELALRSQSDNAPRYYGSIIHSHPISCAFAVLQGTLTQNNYKLVEPNTRQVDLVNREICKLHATNFDDLKTRNIHKVYAKKELSLSLHVYGLGTSQKVMQCFQETLPDHSYHE